MYRTAEVPLPRGDAAHLRGLSCICCWSATLFNVQGSSNTDQKSFPVNLTIFSSLDISFNEIFLWEHDPLVLCLKQSVTIGTTFSFLGSRWWDRGKQIDHMWIFFFFITYWFQNVDKKDRLNIWAKLLENLKKNSKRTSALWDFGKNMKNQSKWQSVH